MPSDREISRIIAKIKRDKRPKELHEFIRNNFPYATLINPYNEYSEEEYKAAKNIISKEEKHFKRDQIELVIQSFACLLNSVKKHIEQTSAIDEKILEDYGNENEEYHRMILNFNKVVQSFYYNFEGNLENEGKIFPIKQVIFKGSHTGESITFEGKILKEIFEPMYIFFDEIYSKQAKEEIKKIRLNPLHFSALIELLDAYEEYHSLLSFLIVNPDKTKHSLRKKFEETEKNNILDRIKIDVAKSSYGFLEKLNENGSSWKCNIIGLILEALDLFKYSGHVDDKKTIKNWIKR